MNTIKQLSISCSLTALALMSFYDQKAMSIFHYCSWLIASLGMLSMVILILSKGARDKIRDGYDKKSKVASFFNRILRLFNIFIIIWFGWYALATLYIFACLLAKVVEGVIKDENK